MPTLRVVAFSDPSPADALARWREAQTWLESAGWQVGPGTAGWAEPPWTLTADPTGGSRAITTLPELIRSLPNEPSPEASHKAWWSMSDNSLVLNALVDRGLCRVFHGHPLTLGGRDASRQKQRFLLWSEALRSGSPFPAEAVPPLVPVRGTWPRVLTLIGGNLGAMERLATTPWRPRPRNRVLLVESLSCLGSDAPSRVGALVSDPWWSGIGGLVFGRFTVADRDDPEWFDRCLGHLPPGLPVARLPNVGHGSDAWTVPLGEPVAFSFRGFTALGAG